MPEVGYDDYAGLDVTGKLVFVLAGEPPRAKQEPLLGTGPAYHADPTLLHNAQPPAYAPVSTSDVS